MSRFEMQPLGYKYNALEPFIDEKTLEIHYNQLYADDLYQLNWAVDKEPEFFQGKTMVDVLKDPLSIPKEIRKIVLDRGGSVLNHEMYFKCMSPNGGGAPMGRLAKDINDQFGNFEGFKRAIARVAQNVYEPGWVWVVVTPDKKLDIVKTLTQANPYSLGVTPLFGIDLWEHAYWAKYPGKIRSYLDAFWNVINWDYIEQRYEEIMK